MITEELNPQKTPSKLKKEKSGSNSIKVLHSEIPIYYAQYYQLNGTRKTQVSRIRDGYIIKRFDKTPLPIHASDVVCPHFLELKWAYGCPYNCSWCYLKGTFRTLKTKTKPVIKDLDLVKTHTSLFLETVNNPEILNAGEICDALLSENNEQPFSKIIIPLFEAQKAHKILFVTKSTNIKHLLDISHPNQTIISFSINAFSVAKKWEKGAPNPIDRINAAKLLSDKGYSVRIRLDPLVPILNWQNEYKQLVDKIFSSFTPDRITIGSLRGLSSTINASSDKTWTTFLSDRSNWGRKIGFKQRLSMYRFLIEQLRENSSYSNFALCKETKSIWEALDLDYTKCKCNCTF